jgi:hypothetical protein
LARRRSGLHRRASREEAGRASSMELEGFPGASQTGCLMPPGRQQRERVMAWQVKLGSLIHDALPDDIGKAQPEIDALYVALLELGIGALLDQMDQAETRAFIHYVLRDISNARSDPRHWRNREALQLAAIYKKTCREMDDRQR